jgi:long-chain acyl-CoA synthetase
VDKSWLKSYAEDVPAELPAPEFKSLREMIEFSFNEFPDRPAYTNMGTTLTYRDLDRLSMKFACYLQKSLGLVRGERVAIMLPNVLQYPVVLFGLFRAGLVAVNVNPLYTPRGTNSRTPVQSASSFLKTLPIHSRRYKVM